MALFIRNEQAGFSKGKIFSNLISTSRQIIEHSNEWNATIYTNFIDFATASDSIQTSLMEDHGKLLYSRNNQPFQLSRLFTKTFKPG